MASNLIVVNTRIQTLEDAGRFIFVDEYINILSKEFEVKVFENLKKDTLSFILFVIKNRNKIKLISFHNIWCIDLIILLWISRIIRIQIDIFAHGTLEPWALLQGSNKKKIFLFILNKLSNERLQLVAITKEELHSLRNIFPKIRLKFVKPLINLTRSSEIEIKEKSKYLYIGRFHKKKGLLELIKAWSLVETNYTSKIELHLYGFGDEEYLKEMKDLIYDYKLKRCFVHGKVDGQEKEKILKEAFCFILPSHSENFGYVIPEALSKGCYIITSKFTPWSDISKHECGAILSSIEPKEIYMKILESHNNNFVPESSYRYFEMKFPPETNKSKIRELLS